jgi:hypothetical protein
MPQHMEDSIDAEGCTDSLAFVGSSPAYYQAHFDQEELEFNQQNDPEVMDALNDTPASPLESFLVPEQSREGPIWTTPDTFDCHKVCAMCTFRTTDDPQMRQLARGRCSSCSSRPLSSSQSSSERCRSAFLDDEHLMEEPY